MSLDVNGEHPLSKGPFEGRGRPDVFKDLTVGGPRDGVHEPVHVLHVNPNHGLNQGPNS